jgi:hypothetical protein
MECRLDMTAASVLYCHHVPLEGTTGGKEHNDSENAVLTVKEDTIEWWSGEIEKNYQDHYVLDRRTLDLVDSLYEIKEKRRVGSTKQQCSLYGRQL